MAVATLVLDRTVDTDKSEYTKETFRDNFMTAEEKHNSQISYNYSKLINPESTLKDFVKKEAPVQPVEENTRTEEAVRERLYRVENARADSALFRADSIINRHAEVNAISASVEEEENEDLRPTPTTIQYKTESVAKTVEEGKIHTKRARTLCLTKKDKIIVAVAVAVIVALFVLIIVNSAIISGLHSEVNTLQENLAAAESSLSETQSAKDAYFNEANLFQVVTEYAQNNGMVRK